MRTLEDLIAEHGVDVTGWRLTSLDDWSDDGRRFVGNGTRNGKAVG